MYYGKRPLVFTALGAMVLGVLLHFTYHWCPNGLAALFAPVGESLWEHGKLVYWPYLLGALWLNRGRPGGIRPWLLTLNGMLLFTLGTGYVHHVLLPVQALWVDIALYLGVMAAGFYLPSRTSGPFTGGKWAIPVVLAAVWGVLFCTFTFYPPDGLLFRDLALRPVWGSIGV